MFVYVLYAYTYIHTYIHTYIPTYLHTYIPTYLHTYLPTYLPTYIHTYIHTYVYIYICIDRAHCKNLVWHIIPNISVSSILTTVTMVLMGHFVDMHHVQGHHHHHHHHQQQQQHHQNHHCHHHPLISFAFMIINIIAAIMAFVCVQLLVAIVFCFKPDISLETQPHRKRRHGGRAAQEL